MTEEIVYIKADTLELFMKDVFIKRYRFPWRSKM